MSRTQFVKLTLETLNVNRVADSPMSSISELDSAHNVLTLSALGSAEALDTTSKDGKKLGIETNNTPSSSSAVTVPGIAPGNPQLLKLPSSQSRNRISSSNSMGSIMTTRGRDTDLESALRVSETATRKPNV
jgi:hypothetical protein